MINLTFLASFICDVKDIYETKEEKRKWRKRRKNVKKKNIGKGGLRKAE